MRRKRRLRRQVCRYQTQGDQGRRFAPRRQGILQGIRYRWRSHGTFRVRPHVRPSRRTWRTVFDYREGFVRQHSQTASGRQSVAFQKLPCGNVRNSLSGKRSKFRNLRREKPPLSHASSHCPGNENGFFRQGEGRSRTFREPDPQDSASTLEERNPTIKPRIFLLSPPAFPVYSAGVFFGNPFRPCPPCVPVSSLVSPVP